MRSVTIARICGLALLLAVPFLFSCDGMYIWPPEFDPQGGYYLEAPLVTIGGNVWDRDTFCYYTIDGSTPDEHSLFYYGPFVVELGTTVKAIAITSDGTASSVSTAYYPEIPEWLVGSIKIADGAEGIAVNGDYAYVVGQTYGLRVFDISDPRHPVGVGSCSVSGGASSITVVGDYAYVTAGGDIQIIDVGDQTQPVLTGFVHIVGDGTCLAVFNNLMCVATTYNGFAVFDISNPANPSILGSCTLPEGRKAIAFSGNYAYITIQQHGLSIVDISDSANPDLLGSWLYDASLINDIVTNGDHIYTVNSYRLKVWNASNPAHPHITNSLSDWGGNKIAIYGKRAYITDGTRGLRVVDVSNPLDSIPIDVFNTNVNTQDAAVSDSLVYVVDKNFGLSILDPD